MTRVHLDRMERQLIDELLILGSMVEQAAEEAVRSLRERDFEASRRIYRGDRKINAMRFAIENSTIMAIATQQPAATDIRILASILEICTELERMGDYAKGIAKINLKIGDEPMLLPMEELTEMARIGTRMLHQALEAFANYDTESSKNVCGDDDLVDALFEKVYAKVIETSINNPEHADQANFLLWAAHYMERFADRVTNICERTQYVQTGKLTEMEDKL